MIRKWRWHIFWENVISPFFWGGKGPKLDLKP